MDGDREYSPLPGLPDWGTSNNKSSDAQYPQYELWYSLFINFRAFTLQLVAGWLLLLLLLDERTVTERDGDRAWLDSSTSTSTSSSLLREDIKQESGTYPTPSYLSAVGE